MKWALAQVDPLVGDLEGNGARIVDVAARAAAAGADIAVFPELCLVGYPPLDLLGEPDLLERAERQVAGVTRELGRRAPDLSVVVGTIAPAGGSTGKPLRNVAALIHGGAVVATRAKSLLPSYDVFDEDRWFEPADVAEPVAHRGLRLGLSVCEDIWNDELYWSRRLYGRDPVCELVAAGADVVVNLSASPYHRGKAAAREEMLRATALRHGRPVVFVNQVGGNDELIFDGRSVVLGPDGVVLARAAHAEEDLCLVEIPPGGTSALPADLPQDTARELRLALVLGLRDYVRKCRFPGVLLGLSGGIDSSVVAALAVDALGADGVEGVLMPSRYSSEGSVRDALALAANLGIRTRTIPIEPLFAAFLRALEPAFAGAAPDVTEENLQARIRGTLLMALSNKHGRLVLSTGNKSELAVGYCTLYGDMNGGLAVIGDCLKGWVRDLAADVNREREVIPRAVLDKPPSAELRPDQRDEDSLPPYPLLDRILEGLVERCQHPAELVAQGLPADVVRTVRRMIDRTEYKRRQAPPILRVTPKAFGLGRRLPIARG
jgi:NAD+ synthetase